MKTDCPLDHWSGELAPPLFLFGGKKRGGVSSLIESILYTLDPFP